MKRTISLVMLAMLLMAAAAGAQVCKRTGLQTDNSSTTDTVFFYDSKSNQRFTARSLYIKLDESANGTISVKRGVKTTIGYAAITWIDDAQALDAGQKIKSMDDEVVCFVFIKSDAADVLIYSASSCAGITEIESAAEFAEPETEWVTLCVGATIPTVGPQTFPVPLCPVGAHKTVTFSISIAAGGTVPDSLYYQFVAASTPTDSLTVMNIGTIAAPALTGAINYPLDASPFHSTGLEIATGVNLEQATNAKYIGIRLRSSAGGDATNVKVVAGLK